MGKKHVHSKGKKKRKHKLGASSSVSSCSSSTSTTTAARELQKRVSKILGENNKGKKAKRMLDAGFPNGICTISDSSDENPVLEELPSSAPQFPPLERTASSELDVMPAPPVL